MQRGQAEALLPRLEAVLNANDIGWRDLDAIAVGIGPGNFTGIRISVSAAKGLSMSLGVPAIGVTLFDVLTYQQDRSSLLACMPAPRDQAYVQRFQNDAPEGPPILVSVSQPPANLQMSFGMHVFGHRADEIGAHYEATTEVAELEDFGPRSARIAETQLQRGTATAPKPLYIRPADAAPPKDKGPVTVP